MPIVRGSHVNINQPIVRDGKGGINKPIALGGRGGGRSRQQDAREGHRWSARQVDKCPLDPSSTKQSSIREAAQVLLNLIEGL